MDVEALLSELEAALAATADAGSVLGNAADAQRLGVLANRVSAATLALGQEAQKVKGEWLLAHGGPGGSGDPSRLIGGEGAVAPSPSEAAPEPGSFSHTIGFPSAMDRVTGAVLE